MKKRIEDYVLTEELEVLPNYAVCRATNTSGNTLHNVLVFKKTTEEEGGKTEADFVVEENSRLFENFDHPNLPSLFHFAESKRSYYFFLSKFEAGSLLSRVQKSGPLSEDDLAIFALEMLGALRYLEENKLVCKDLSLEGVFLEGGRYLLCDLGLNEDLNKIKGAPASRTRSPESLKGSFGIKGALFGLGCCLYRLAFGEYPPWRPVSQYKSHLACVETLQASAGARLSFPRNVSEGLKKLLRKLTEPDEKVRGGLDFISKDEFLLEKAKLLVKKGLSGWPSRHFASPQGVEQGRSGEFRQVRALLMNEKLKSIFLLREAKRLKLVSRVSLLLAEDSIAAALVLARQAERKLRKLRASLNDLVERAAPQILEHWTRDLHAHWLLAQELVNSIKASRSLEFSVIINKVQNDQATNSEDSFLAESQIVAQNLELYDPEKPATNQEELDRLCLGEKYEKMKPAAQNENLASFERQLVEETLVRLFLCIDADKFFEMKGGKAFDWEAVERDLEDERLRRALFEVLEP